MAPPNQADPAAPPLAPSAQSFVSDPNFADVVDEGAAPVANGRPTSGPNRFTAHVPTETSVLSLGAANATPWKTDLGITGYTDSHIHFETKSVARTVMSLGGPATKATLEGDGNKASESEAGSAPEGEKSAPEGASKHAPTSSNGYSMVTEQNAWHDAQLQHYLLSVAHDAALRTKGPGKRAVLQSDAGTVDINGGLEVNVAAGGVLIGASPDVEIKTTAEEVGYTKPWKGEPPKSLAATLSGAANTFVGMAVNVHNLYTSFSHTWKKPTPGSILDHLDHYADVVEWLADGAETVRALGELYEVMFGEEATEGSVKIGAEEDIGIAAGKSVSLFGALGASLSSTVWTSVSAIGSAALKATLFAGMTGGYASVKGYKKVELSSDLGNAEFNADTKLAVKSDKGDFIAVGKTHAQLSSAGSAYFTGTTSAWIGVSAGGGWGLACKNTEMEIGKATSADQMLAAAVDAGRSIKVFDNGFLLTSGSTKMELVKQHIHSDTGSVKLDATNNDVTVGGDKILINTA
jgi:hypothetical protein